MMKAPVFAILAVTFVTLWNSSSSLPRRKLDWWETTVIYQVYPRSFKDSDGDGIGDLKGIIEKLDYIKETGFETIWIQPFYKSPMDDNGYDISDFRQVDPLFGTMNDVKEMIKGIHDRGMKVILDYVPNHVSRDCEWFKLSEDKVEPYTDYFIWKDAKRVNATHTTVPNNWRSIFGGTAWEWSEKRQQYYFKQFSPKQPDLNFRNPKVRKEMEDVIRFWLDLDIDGLRIDAIKFLIEADHFMDEPKIKEVAPGANDYSAYSHIYTVCQEENYEVMHEWGLVMDEYKKKDGKTRILAPESYDPPEILVRYLGNDSYPSAQIPFYFDFVFYNYEQNTTVLDNIIRRWNDAMVPKNMFPNWVIGNHDRFRPATRITPEGADAFNIIDLMLPGQASVYYGDELGMEDAILRPDQIVDPFNMGDTSTASRDYPRSPMIWDDTINAGFTTSKKPWLPIHPSYWNKNVKSQLQASNSHLKIFKRLMALRKEDVVIYGDLNTYVMSEWTYMFTRTLENETSVVVIINLGSESSPICAQRFATDLPATLTVHTASLNAGFNTGDQVRISEANGNQCTYLRPKASLVLLASQSSHGDLLTSCIYLVVLSVAANLLRST